MSKRKDEMVKQRLLAERDRLLRQREALENQITGIERAIALIDGDGADGASTASATASGHVRGRIKTLIIDMLREVGTTGLNAQTAVELADRRGISLGKESVSSLLSRLKKDDVVVYDGDKYRLREFSQPNTPKFALVGA